jgi:predicted ATP-grasp superfamily ATP-dependent carboligase
MVSSLDRGRAIVTYGRSLMALTIAQSLGSRGVEVIGCDDVGLTALSFSRYAKKHYVHASASTDPERFIDDLEAAIIRHKPTDDRPYVLMPCFQETRLIARHAERLSRHIKVAAPGIDAIRAVDPKDSLMHTARRLELRIPST